MESVISLIALLRDVEQASPGFGCLFSSVLRPKQFVIVVGAFHHVIILASSWRRYCASNQEVFDWVGQGCVDIPEFPGPRHSHFPDV